MVPRRRVTALLAALLLWPLRAEAGPADAVSTLEGIHSRLRACWRPPALLRGHPGMEITVLFSFTRSGELLGRPRITFETPEASEADAIAYRTAVMQTLQHCTPMPFTGGLGDAVAGRPFRLRFDDRRPSPERIEKRAWLSPKTL